mmetsp:Transcript_22125/g.40673  ORF Transcript_22125/g.40673 Transcript_22125/m.40673 type:complete len:109 (-) Transcript_22125:195-521(-)
MAGVSPIDRFKTRHPGKVPVICEKSSLSYLPDLAKKKFLLPEGMVITEFRYIVCRELFLVASTEQTVYLFVGNMVPKTNVLMSELHEKHHASDGILYIRYSEENTLGF